MIIFLDKHKLMCYNIFHIVIISVLPYMTHKKSRKNKKMRKSRHIPCTA